MPPLTKHGKPSPLPNFISPELATLTDKAPAGDSWIHEIKLDGYRTASFLGLREDKPARGVKLAPLVDAVQPAG